MSPRSIRCCVASITAVAALLAGESAARATPDFPDAVVTDLGLTGIMIDCTMCHPNDLGGTTVRPFGQLLEQYGVAANNEGSLRQALAELEAENPKVIADIKAGKDPNGDVSGLPSPEYGCAAGATGDVRSSAAGVVACLLAVGAVLGGRRRRRSSEASE